MYILHHVFQSKSSSFSLDTDSNVSLLVSEFWTHLSQQVTVEDLEHFVEAKLAQSLHGVADEGGSPALRKTSDSIFPHCHCKAVANTLEFLWVHLRRRNNSVRKHVDKSLAALGSGVLSRYL